jgi:exodeoxyribonuclease VII small subunit
MTKKKSTTENAPTFEAALGELEALVDELETGDLNLAESLQKFERGVGLARQCQLSLNRAEQKILTLSEATENIDDAAETRPAD